MIHQQEKLELLTQQIEIANTAVENKLMSREWIYDNIFEFNSQDKDKVFEGILEDTKNKFRFEQIETEGNDPAKTGEKIEDEEEDDDFSMSRKSSWGGSEKDRFKKDINPHGANAEDLKNATSYNREKRKNKKFKGGSPLATSKGSTLVAREGLMNQLKSIYGKNVVDKSILNEKSVLFDDNNENNKEK